MATSTPIKSLFWRFGRKQIPAQAPAKARHFAALDPNQTTIDIVIPVYNEKKALTKSIAALHAYATKNIPQRWHITIADNASTDRTLSIANELAASMNNVRAVHLDQKGRGRALREVWLRSDADILAYMDVDLSTDLSALRPLIQPLIDGEAPIAIATRLAPGSEVARGAKREFISRSYNKILKWTLGMKASDAQCGFKAIRRDAAQEILPEITDNNWFFDTELLTKAEHKGWAIHEVPVIWKDDPDSRVNIVRTAIDDLKGIERVRRERKQSPAWEKPAIWALLLSTFAIYLFGALHNGMANSYYSAAVQAATTSWKAFFFGSLDGASFITVDKPPVAIWIMALSARIFGFSTFSMLLPNAIMGAGTMALVYASVKRLFGIKSGFIAALTMLITPVAALMFGFNNPDAALTFFLTASGYTFLRALEGKHALRWLSLTGILTGFAFNTKMLQGLMVVPIMGLVYLAFAKPNFLTRMAHMSVAGVVTAISTFWWSIVVWLTPASSRPFIGSTGSTNNIWDLIFGYNGLGRLLGKGSGMGGGMTGGGAPGAGGAQIAQAAGNAAQTTGGMMPTGGGGGGMGPGGTGFGGKTGPLRIFNTDFGPNIAWFIPLALIISGFTVWALRKAVRHNIQRAAILFWAGWMVLHIAIFSITSGVIHPYYPVVMTPAIAALVGIGLPIMWDAYKKRHATAWVLPASIAATSLTSFILLGYGGAWPWLNWSVLLVGGAASIILLLNAPDVRNKINKIALWAGLIACVAGPIAFTAATVNAKHTGSIPTSGPSASAVNRTNNESANADSALVSYLLAHQGSATWLVAVSSANESAPIQLSSGQPVMALGGFSGSDQGVTLAQFIQYVKDGKIKYLITGSTNGMGGGRGAESSEITTWAKAHGTLVNYGGSETLYELHAE